MSKPVSPTVLEHLNALPKPYRQQAIKNVRHNYILKNRYQSQAYALQIAFVWEHSEQGQEYWLKVWREILNLKKTTA